MERKKERKNRLKIVVAQQWWDSISLLGWADIIVPETLLLLSGHQAESAAWACYLSKSLNPTPVPPIALMIHTGDSPHCAPECSLLCSHAHWLHCHCVSVCECVYWYTKLSFPDHWPNGLRPSGDPHLSQLAQASTLTKVRVLERYCFLQSYLTWENSQVLLLNTLG